MSHPAPPPYAGQPGQPGPSLHKPASSGPPPGGPVLDLSGTTSIPLWRLVQVEARKSVDTLASLWLLVGIAIAVVGVEVLLTIIVIAQEGGSTPGDYAVVASYITAFALPVLAIMLVTTEWSQRTAMVTFSIEPRRERVMAAKYVVCLALTLAAVVLGLVVGFVCAGVCEIFVPEQTEWTIRWSEIGGFFVTQVLAMTLGYALAALLLNTPAAIVAFFVYRILPLVAFAVIAQFVDWFADIRPFIDFEYAKGPLYDLSMNTGEEWAHFLVSGTLWLVLPLAFGMLRILRAEVK